MTRAALALTGLLLAVSGLWAQERGSIEGSVRLAGDRGVGGVTVALAPGNAVVLTDARGLFAFRGLAAGEYSLRFSLGSLRSVRDGVEVAAGEATVVEETVDWSLSFADQVTVYSASRRQERIVEAPAAITTLTRSEIELESPPGQLPKLLEFTPGVELTQAGLFDFNLNARGFNNSTNRRVQTHVDGREMSVPIVATPEWMAMTSFTNDLSRVELVRGPSSALYGANAFNGVLNLVTKAPRDSTGGSLDFALGELDTTKLDFRWSGELAEEWYLKALGGYYESSSFNRSRNVEVEYPGLMLEAVPLPSDTIELSTGLVRADRYTGPGVFSLEAGATDGRNETVLVSVGRGTAPEFLRWWARANYNSPRWNVLGYFNGRDGDDQLALSSGSLTFEDSYDFRLELQGNASFSENRSRLVGGAYFGGRSIDTADRRGVQTLFAERVRTDEKAAFGQFERDIGSDLKIVVAARWDESDLHDSELSPKASIVYALTPRHRLRLGYNQAFQVGNHLELFLDLPAGLPLDLSPLEQELQPLLGGVPLGLESVPIRAMGNQELETEKIQSVELGYNGILAQSTFLTLDFYYNEMEDFITDLLPGANPAFGPYRAPPGLQPGAAFFVESLLNGLLPGLTNDSAGGPLFLLSHGNTGRVDAEGVEAGLSHGLGSRWLFDYTYRWFDFDVRDEQFSDLVHPNAPENQLSVGITFSSPSSRVAVRYRWVEDFEWASGVFAGRVPSYDVVNLSADHELSSRWTLGLAISNLLDEEHFEAFGGDLIGRRALGYASFSW